MAGLGARVPREKRESLLEVENLYSSPAEVLGLTSISFRGLQRALGVPKALEIICKMMHMFTCREEAP